MLSPGAYELVKAVDNLCNLRSAEQLGKARSIIGERQSAGEISLDEQQMLNDILDLADQGHWDTAIARCRQLLVAQIDR